MSIYLYYSHKNCVGIPLLYKDGVTYWTEQMCPSDGYSINPENGKLRLFLMNDFCFEYVGEL